MWVPDVELRRLSGARRTLRHRGFEVEVRWRMGGLLASLWRPGDVVAQHPGAYSQRVQGSTVTLVVFRPPFVSASSSTGNDYGTGGYENPAPGDDGTPDCAPGQPPVWVGNDDPYDLDGNGDGWGCE